VAFVSREELSLLVEQQKEQEALKELARGTYSAAERLGTEGMSARWLSTGVGEGEYVALVIEAWLPSGAHALLVTEAPDAAGARESRWREAKGGNGY
jgi:hypothetical protein